MPLSSIPPNLSTAQYQHLVLQALEEIAGPGATLMSNPPILSTADFRHLVLYALQFIANKEGLPNVTSPNGDVWAISVDDDGIVTTTKV
jgi:hypothetical protein